MTPFITSKIGQIDKVILFSYEFTDSLRTQINQLNKFSQWLTYTQTDNLYEISGRGFKTFRPLQENSTWQYILKESDSIYPPYSNTQLISKFVSHHIGLSFATKYERFLNKNIFITDSKDFGIITLKKCIEFKVEVFSNGKLLINFLPTTKIVSNQKVSVEYLTNLKFQSNLILEDLFINLINIKNFKRQKINLIDNEYLDKSKLFIGNDPNIIATFDYHFIAKYSSSLFGKVIDETIKDIDNSVYYLQEKLKDIIFKESYKFQTKPFFKVEVNNLGIENNLIIGNNKFSNKPSAAFYNGVYKPVDNAKIQPIIIDDYSDVSNFIDLVNRFNKGSVNYEILSPVKISSNDSSLQEFISQGQFKNSKNILFAIFTRYEQPYDFFKILNQSKIYYQIYLGQIDIYKLSNFVVKCLEKQGGILSVIKEIGVKNHTYFIGIDLGHAHLPKFSNLALVFFDKNGRFLHSFVNKNLPLNESITPEGIWPCLFSFYKFLKQNNLPLPEKIIIHRDGKLHSNEIETIIKQVEKQLHTKNVEIVEIIKSGYPVFAYFETGAYLNLDSGNSYIDHENKYSLLITNTQADQKNALNSPIIIKHKFGTLTMETIVEQVYWFTKIYTNNLYQSTRLPATTLKANNIVSTSLKIHHSTYLG